MTFCSFGGYGINLVLTQPIFCSSKVTIFGCFNKCLQPMMLFNNVLKVVVAALFLHYDCFATFYEHALQHVFEEFALFGGTLSHIMLANSHCVKKNKLPLQNEQTTSSHEQAFYVFFSMVCARLIFKKKKKNSPRRSRRGPLGISSPGGPVKEPLKPFCSFFFSSSSFVVRRVSMGILETDTWPEQDHKRESTLAQTFEICQNTSQHLRVFWIYNRLYSNIASWLSNGECFAEKMICGLVMYLCLV